MAAAVYPVIFTPVDDVVLIEVPDLDILTQGKDMADAIEMARDAIGLKCIFLEDEKEPIPAATSINAVDPKKGAFAEDGPGVVSFVDVDLKAYRRMIDNKMVRRNVTLPNWLDCAAEKAKLNVSKILQDALMNALGVSPSTH